mmetsp:Transcript_42945/g.139350  ORF Transcript_42945/g.139350 Transcript_42945/m.139350 type:complete len:102 (+) Transcript_42945:510-815(+)
MTDSATSASSPAALTSQAASTARAATRSRPTWTTFVYRLRRRAGDLGTSPHKPYLADPQDVDDDDEGDEGEPEGDEASAEEEKVLQTLHDEAKRVDRGELV